MSSIDETRAQQQQAWNLASRGWRKWDEFLMGWLQPIGEKILELAGLKDDYIVLDAATGSGEPGLSAARRVRKGRVVGIDLSEEMVRIAADKARRLGLKNYETRVHDSSALPFATNHFDAVVCRFGVMFFPDMLLGLKELVRVLKPAKRLIVSVWGPQDERAKAVQEILMKRFQLPQPAPDAPGPYRCSERGRISLLLNEAGLHDVKEIELKGQRAWDSPEQYWEFITDISPMIATAASKVTDDVRKKTRREVLEALRAVEGKHGKISFDWVAWIDYGMK